MRCGLFLVHNMSEPIIIALSGHKGSGKNTLATFIAKHFVSTVGAWWCGNCCRIAKEFAFADGIKDFCIDVLGLEPKQCYGSDEEKNTPTEYRWENTPQFHLGWDGPDCMTGREVMQAFGTECVRAWFGNVWAEATIRKIQKGYVDRMHGQRICDLAIITDNRFPNEVETVLGQPNGYIIRLTRSPYAGSDSHVSEVALNGFDWVRPSCFVLNNAQMTIDEQNDAVISILDGIFQQGAGK